MAKQNLVKSSAGKEALSPADIQYIVQEYRKLDTDTAHVALSQARAILDLLVTAAEANAVDIPDTESVTLVQSIYLAISEIGRAQKALAMGVDHD